MSTFCEFFHDLRKSQNPPVLQADIAEAVGMPAHRVSDWERGAIRPPCKTGVLGKAMKSFRPEDATIVIHAAAIERGKLEFDTVEDNEVTRMLVQLVLALNRSDAEDTAAKILSVLPGSKVKPKQAVKSKRIVVRPKGRKS